MNSLCIKGKRIMFFTASFFGYENDIRKVLEQAGAEVDFFNERVNENTITKALIRINPNFIRSKINRYYKRIIESTKNKEYDFVFFINIEAASKSIISRIRQTHPRAKFLLYEWDSIANNPHAQELLSSFDNVWSFDKNDCLKFGMSFLPLFYNNEYASIAQGTCLFLYDTLFVGTTHSDRFRYVSSINEQVSSYGGQSFSWFYFPSFLLYIKMKLQDECFRKHAMKRDVRFKSLNKNQLVNLVASSRVLVDAQHPKQMGLTMRTLEALGAKRKLITTNCDVKNYDFYHPNNILVVDRINPRVPKRFIESPYEEISPAIYEKYSLDSWLKTIFEV